MIITSARPRPRPVIVSGGGGGSGFDGFSWRANEPETGYVPFMDWGCTLPEPDEVSEIVESDRLDEIIDPTAPVSASNVLRFNIPYFVDTQIASPWLSIPFPAGVKRFYVARALRPSPNLTSETGGGCKTMMADGVGANSLYMNVGVATTEGDPYPLPWFWVAGADARKDSFLTPASPNPITRGTWGMWEQEVDATNGILRTWSNGVLQHNFTDINWTNEDWARIRPNWHHNNTGNIVPEGGIYWDMDQIFVAIGDD